MNAFLEQINSTGESFIDFALPMLIQSSVLIIILLGLDLLLRKRIRAIFRYWIWMIVLIKLMLPPALSLPTSPSYWFGQKINRPLYVSVTSSLADDNYNTMSPYKNRYPKTNISTGGMVSPFYFVNNDSVFQAQSKIPEISLSWQGSVFLAWFIIVVIMVILLIQKTFFVRRLIIQSQCMEGKIIDILEDARLKIGIKKKISLRLSDIALSPSVCGLFRPSILIPKALVEKINPDDLNSIMLHEMAHIKRYDLWVNLVQAILQIIYIYNPLLWIANIIIRNVREQAVDEMVLVAMGEQAEEYPKTLLIISKYSFGSAAFSLRLIGVAESKKAMFARIKHITSRPFPTNAKLGIFGVFIIFFIACFFLPMARAKKLSESNSGIDSFLYANLTNATPSPYEMIRQARTGKTESSSAETLKTERIVHFPKDRSLGKLYLYDKTKNERFQYWFHWSWNSFSYDGDYFCEASGDVKVPAGKELCLSISYNALKDLSPLLNLRPDDLFNIDFSSSDENKPVADIAMLYISKLKGLKSLFLHTANITDEGMKYITSLKSLDILHLPDQATDISMAYVSQLTSLKRLFVKETGSLITDEGIKYIAKLTNLEELALSGDNMGDNGLVYIKNLPKLEYLFLRGRNFGDRGMVHLKDMKSLKALSFHEGVGYISDAGLPDISKISNLESLCLHGMKNITDEGISHLTKMHSLKKLMIDSAQITNKGLLDLSQIKTLEYLELPGPDGITDTGVSSLGSLPNLRLLKISQSHRAVDYYTDKSLESISKCKLLEELTIGSPGITDTGLNHVAKLMNLKKLYLFGCDKITDKGLAELTALKSLKLLYMNGGQITISGINQLNSLTNLTHLDIYEYEPDGSTLDLSGLTSLEKLRTYHHSNSGKFTDEDLKSLSGLKNLHWLHILPSDFTDKGMSYLSGLTNIDTLIISGDSISDEGLKYLANMKRLVTLNIKNCNITDKGLRYLEELETLSTIDITSENDLSDASLRRLLNKLPHISELKINGTKLQNIN